MTYLRTRIAEVLREHFYEGYSVTRVEAAVEEIMSLFDTPEGEITELAWSKDAPMNEINMFAAINAVIRKVNRL